MKSIFIIFLAFVNLTAFNFNNGEQNNKQNVNTRDAASGNFISQDILSNSSTNHRLNHNLKKFLRIEIILNDDYSKDNSPIYSSPYKMSSNKCGISYNQKSVNQLINFLPAFSQSQKSIQSEFLLI